MGDVRFYDFDFNLLYILPASAEKTGYISMNAQKEFNGNGSLELVFCDEELKKIIDTHKDVLLISWDNFQGFITGHRWDTRYRVTGKHLNGLLKRAVIKKTTTELNGDVETLAREAIENNVAWLTFGEECGTVKKVKYSTDKYLKANEYIQNLLRLDKAGYEIKADFINKKYIFSCIKSKENPIILSEENLNAYEFETTYTNSDLAFSGWYEKEQPEDSEGNKPDPVWTYITLDETKKGIHNIVDILSATNETDAINELKNKKSLYEIAVQTRGLKCGVDYRVGDIIRVQNDGIITKKLVSGVSMWSEQGYGEEPILTEMED